MCEECYSLNPRATTLLNPKECLLNHTQYICGTCGRCICIEKDSKRQLQRWNFPFKTLEIAKLYLRTADFSLKKSCGIYEIEGKNKRVFYKIFESTDSLNNYLESNKDKICKTKESLFSVNPFKEFSNTKVRKLTPNEIKKYLLEKEEK